MIRTPEAPTQNEPVPFPSPDGNSARSTEVVHPTRHILQDLLKAFLIHPEDWEKLPAGTRQELSRLSDGSQLFARLVEHQLLTEYQVTRLQAGNLAGLLVGNYRILDRLGAGGMGVIYKGEHKRLRRQVAIKVLSMSSDRHLQMLPRFFNEMQAVAQLRHPNIVAALDAGEVAAPDPESAVLHYLVMEYVAGQDLQQYVENRGPLSPAETCDVGYQSASALAEAHKHHLIHRDIKPSNILLTPEGQAMLLDFGLARRFHHRLTEAGTVLGTVDYMAPWQMQDSQKVDGRADLYGVGGVMYWCLTRRLPFPRQANLAGDLTYRLSSPPPSVRAAAPDVSAELDAVIARLLAPQPEDCYPNAEAVMRALLPFLKTETHYLRGQGKDAGAPQREPVASPGGPDSGVHQVLIVDDEPQLRKVCRLALQSDRLHCQEAGDGVQALRAVESGEFDLVLLDIDMPEMTGWQVLQRLREAPRHPHLKIIMFSGRASPDEMAQTLAAGADDYLTKPFSPVQLRARVKAALRLKDAQERSDLLAHHLLEVNTELERGLNARDGDLVHARSALVLALATLVEYRDTEPSSHLLRLQQYCRCLAEQAAQLPNFAALINPDYVRMLESSVPLHDIGKVGLPDHILQKPGRLDPDELVFMQSHTLIGADTLKKVAQRHGSSLAFLQMAIDIARHHHERFDGAGYPDQLAGADIPLAARLVKICDTYDALRSRRPHRPALSHVAALKVMTELSEGEFDPVLLQSFRQCAPQFEKIFREVTDRPER